MTKFIVKSPKPRNPLAVAARKRHAGPHGQHGDARRDGRQSLRRELAALSQDRPPSL